MRRVRKTRDCQNISVGMIGFLSVFRVVAVSLFGVQYQVRRGMKMNRYDMVSWFGGIGILLIGLSCLYGAFYWVNTFVSPFYGLTLVEVLEMPVLTIVFAFMSIWIVPGLGIAGLGIILGLVKAVLD